MSTQTNKQANKQARLTETTLNRFRDIKFVISKFDYYNQSHHLDSDKMEKIEEVLNTYSIGDVLTFFDCFESFQNFDSDDSNELFERYEQIEYIRNYINHNMSKIILYMCYVSDVDYNDYYDLYDLIYIDNVNYHETKRLFSIIFDSYDDNYKIIKRLNKFYNNYY